MRAKNDIHFRVTGYLWLCKVEKGLSLWVKARMFGELIQVLVPPPPRRRKSLVQACRSCCVSAHTSHDNDRTLIFSHFTSFSLVSCLTLLNVVPNYVKHSHIQSQGAAERCGLRTGLHVRAGLLFRLASPQASGPFQRWH